MTWTIILARSMKDVVSGTTDVGISKSVNGDPR